MAVTVVRLLVKLLMPSKVVFKAPVDVFLTSSELAVEPVTDRFDNAIVALPVELFRILIPSLAGLTTVILLTEPLMIPPLAKISRP